MTATSDFLIAKHGSIILLTPISEDANTWCAENLPSDAMRHGASYVVESRYIDDIVAGTEAANLTVG
jgi:hypothetical protein